MKRRLGLLIVCCSVQLGIGRDQAVAQTEVGSLIFSGRVNRVVMLVEDGASANVFFMDSEQAFSMLRAEVDKRHDGGWTVSGALEVGIQSNPATGSLLVTGGSRSVFSHSRTGMRTYYVTRPDISLKRLHTLTTGAMLSF